MARRSSIRWQRLALPAVSIALFFSLLEIAGRVGLYETSLVPLPSSVARAMEWLVRGPFFADLSATARRIATGYVVGASLGIILGLATGLLSRVRNLLEPVVQLGRPIPAVALVPLALAWFGIGELAKASIVAWACFFPVWINTHSGVGRVPAELLWTSAVLGANRGRTVLQVVIPWASSFIFVGLRTSLGLAFAAVVVAEMSGASSGLGYRILASHYAFRVDEMLASIIAIGALGALTDLLFRATARHVVPWLGHDEGVHVR